MFLRSDDYVWIVRCNGKMMARRGNEKQATLVGERLIRLQQKYYIEMGWEDEMFDPVWTIQRRNRNRCNWDIPVE